MWNLLPLMLERMGIIVVIAFVISRIKPFRHALYQSTNIKEKILLAIIFSLFGIISNYTGIEIHGNTIVHQSWLAEISDFNAIANTRTMDVVIGGVLGGPVVGIIAGISAGIHRYFLGGFTATACGLSTILAGIVSGLAHVYIKKKNVQAPYIMIALGMTLELAQMGIILLVAKPYEVALALVSTIAIPMVMINGFGILLFTFILQSISKEEEKTSAQATHIAFLIAEKTLPYFRQGLHSISAQKAANVIFQLSGADAIAITNTTKVLAHIGAASDHHQPLQPFLTELTHTVLKQKRIIATKSKSIITCSNPSCPLEAAIVLPLIVREEAVGTLKLYFCNPDRLDMVAKELAEGLAKLFSMQLELGAAEFETHLLKDAEIKALQAQINPHFFFNSINTITSLCRTNTEKARSLLIQLATYFRSNLRGTNHLVIPLEKELEHVQAYVAIEEARFPHLYNVLYDIKNDLLSIPIPPFTLQPLVENALRYGFPSYKEKGTVMVKATCKQNKLIISVIDNGVGIPRDKLQSLGSCTVDSSMGTGTALFNIHQRLQKLYQHDSFFTIHSEEGLGTEVIFSIPIDRDIHRKEDSHVKSISR